MSSILLITVTCLLVQATQSYILLTANLEDFQSLARQVMSSPIGARLGKIWMRAYDQFSQAIQSEDRQRANRRFSDGDEDEEASPQRYTRGPEDRGVKDED